MSPLGQLREVLTNLIAGDRRRDRLELTANLGGRFELHIKRVVMTRRASQEDDHQRLRFPTGRSCPDAVVGRIRALIRNLRETDPHQA
ncbi:MAG: hypothetical protein NT013_30935 [Planctomycetia bacterium]|nr:hypothetical protein [Planctomycetia bacterium]